ncbi:hypothetical protein ACGGKE_03685 [Sphingobium naphthae]|uniref:hypothetical protein n=1 Tax=Sphingobium naphthae TaxID=1886786 RepID=UPI0037483C84
MKIMTLTALQRQTLRRAMRGSSSPPSTRSPPSFLTELEALRAERGRMMEGLQDARAGFEASQVLISALSNGHPSVMIETFIERIDAALKEPSQ